MRKKHFLLILFLLPFILYAISDSINANGTSSVLQVRLNNDIGLAEEGMFDDIINTAQSSGIDLILLELNTPGGTVDAVQAIMVKFANSPIPILTWIPVGGAAWSGGTYLLMASQIAAMGSGSVTGSCQPVGNDGQPLTDSKYINALVGLMTEHAKLHNRNESLAEDFITDNTNVGADEALANNVIEFTADTIPALLADLNHYSLVWNQTGELNYTTLVETSSGTSFNGALIVNFTTINVESASVFQYNPGISYYFIRFITNPTVVSIFLTIGSFGLVIGLTTTNTHLDEIVGAITLVIGLIGIGIIGITVGAIILFIIGLAFFLAEIKFNVGFNGSLAIGGGVCIAIASLFIIPASQYWTVPGFLNTAKWSAFGVSVIIIVFLSLIAIKVLQTKYLKSELDTDQLIGARGYVKIALKPEGQVIVKSEIWTAVAVEGTWPILEDEQIEVVSVNGVKLTVKPLQEGD
ncbi:MAG: NfeD family protein [Candidatus Helarchaeota archaeon]